jgi:hypothetical protein
MILSYNATNWQCWSYKATMLLVTELRCTLWAMLLYILWTMLLPNWVIFIQFFLMLVCCPVRQLVSSLLEGKTGIMEWNDGIRWPTNPLRYRNAPVADWDDNCWNADASSINLLAIRIRYQNILVIDRDTWGQNADAGDIGLDADVQLWPLDKTQEQGTQGYVYLLVK